MKVKCPACGSDKFEEQKGSVFTQCCGCKLVYFKRELVVNWKRWNTPKHIEWVRLWGEHERKR